VCSSDLATVLRGPAPGGGGPSSLLTDLVAYWKLDEASGTRVDSTESGLDLTDNNTVTQAAGKVGNAGQFTAANSEYLSRANEAAIDPGDTTFYVAMWVYRDAAGSYHMLATRYAAGGDATYELRISNANLLQWNVYAGAATTRGSKAHSSAIGAAAWTFVEAYHDAAANEIGVAINGGAWQTAATSGALAQSNVPLRIGARSDGFYMNGRIDEVGIWSRIPTAGERATLYNGGAGTTHPF
jgi:hypothetical protein